MSLSITAALHVSGPFDQIQPEDGWPLVLTTYRLTICERPDSNKYISSLLDYWKADPEITAIVPVANINQRIAKNAVAFTPYITVTQAGGTQDPYKPLFYPLIDVRCFGKTPYEADILSEVVQRSLIPLDRRSFGVA